jgi:hypothetical protein
MARGGRLEAGVTGGSGRSTTPPAWRPCGPLVLGDDKRDLAQLLLQTSERFLHLWTVNRSRMNFAEIRRKMLADKTIDAIIKENDLFEDSRGR